MDAKEFIKSQWRAAGENEACIWGKINSLVIKNPKLRTDQRNIIKDMVKRHSSSSPNDTNFLAMHIATYIHSLD